MIKTWDLPTRGESFTVKAHESMVRGLCWTDESKLLSCGTDCLINLFDPCETSSNFTKSLAMYRGKHGFTGLSHHRNTPTFVASTSTGVDVFDRGKSALIPIQHFQWPTSVDTVNDVAFNPVETSIVGSSASDRSIVLYDLRTASPIHRLTLKMNTNKISWNPMEAMNFAAANEDHRIYLFDARNLSRALNVCKDHVAAVMSVCFSPTGQELVSGSYDRTVRVWSRASGHSRDVYHTKRQQRVWSVVWSSDNGYLLSGSDDGNVRLWRANASQRRGPVSARQRQTLEYQETLTKRYEHMPEIRRIAKHRHLPSTVKKAGEIKREEESAIKRRNENRRKHEKKSVANHSRPSERQRNVVAVEE